MYSYYELHHLAHERGDELRREAHAARLARAGRSGRLRRSRRLLARRWLILGARGHAA